MTGSTQSNRKNMMAILPGILAIVLVTFAAYYPSWHGDFVWDDQFMLFNNPVTISPDGWFMFWIPGQSMDFFPLTMDMFWLQWHLFGMNPTGYHLVNIALHALAAVLAWRVLERLKVPGAWFAGLVFALHPLAVTSAAWISELKNTLAMPLAFASLLFHLKADEHEASLSTAPPSLKSPGFSRFSIVSIILFLLALLSKTAIVMLPIVMLLCTWHQSGRISRNALVRTAPMFICSALLGILTIIFQVEYSMSDLPLENLPLTVRMVHASWAAWFYLWKALWPADLLMIYPKWDGAFPWYGYLPLPAVIALPAVLWVARKRIGTGPFLGIISYLVMVLPTLGLVAMSIHRYQRVADHLVYPALLPLIAIAVGAAARAMATCRNEKLIKTAVALAVAIALFYPTYQRAESFSDGLRLWKRDLSIWPGSWGALNELGFVYAQLAMDLQRQGEQGKAEGAYRTAAGHFSESVRIRPDFLNAWMNLGNAQSALMRFETATNHEKEAEELFSASVASYRKALELFPGSVKSRLNLALLYMEKERFAEAVPELRILAKADPKEWPPRLLLGVALVRQSSRTNDSALSPESAALSREAAGLLEQVTREAPDNAEAWLNLCIANYNQMNLAKAHDACVEALRLSPEDGEARLYLGLVLKETGKKEKAPGR